MVNLLAMAPNLHQPGWLQTHNPANCLPPAPQHTLQRPRASTPLSTPGRVEEESNTEAEESVIGEDEDDDSDEVERDSTKIILDLKTRSVDVVADVDCISSVNWISQRLLVGSNIDVVPAKYVTHQRPDGVRLESKGCVIVHWRRSLLEKVFPGEFMVYASKTGSPSVVLGKAWAQKFGESVSMREKSRRIGVTRMRTGSQSVAGQSIMKLPERQRLKRRYGDSMSPKW